MAGNDGRDGDLNGDVSNEAGSGVDVETFLSEVDFDAEGNVLTRRQAEVLVLRERGLKQSTIADRLGTSRANVSSIEASARENVEKARETVRFAELVSPPVHVKIPADSDLYEVPDLVFEACDDVGVKVSHSAPELMRIVSDEAGDAIENRHVHTGLVINVTADGTVWVREI